MPQPKNYDTTIARMAGNILAGLLAVPAHAPDDPTTVNLAVDLARAIVARVQQMDQVLK